MHFRGVDAEDSAEHWITAEGAARARRLQRRRDVSSSRRAPLEYDAEHNAKLNLWSYDDPRFTKPFYYGQTMKNMVFMLMFDQAPRRRGRDSFQPVQVQAHKLPRPAWDWQYVIHHVEAGREYGFRARLVWKQYRNADDCLDEYERWRQKLTAARQ